jgi:prepilin-type N-terminal cleavage/methylation domain-containing protein/prepilin-type processing-associated H-X9-DG protein
MIRLIGIIRGDRIRTEVLMRSHPKQGFTLVELLVVIGIIALLVGILLPVLTGVRRSAMSVKCMSNLRQCGQALLLYAHNNKGALIPIRCGGGAPNSSGPNEPSQLIAQAIEYDLYGFTYGSATNDATHSTSAAWWMNFLAKYMTSERGGTGDISFTSQALARNSPYWCPAWRPVDIADALHPEWVHATGYSMNYMVSLTGNHPLSNNDATTTNVPPKEWLNIQLQAGGGIVPSGGTWYKQTQIRNPAERCFLADSAYLMLVSWKAPVLPANVKAAPPPQNLLPTAQTGPYTAGINGQNSFDCYRHGVYPGVAAYSGVFGAGTAFKQTGGKVSYNILYFDGHVSNSVDRADGYRAVRMHYPG